MKLLRLVIVVSLFATAAGCLRASTETVAAQIVVTPSSATVEVGGTLQLHALVAGPDDHSVSWTVSHGAGAVDGDGLYHAPASMPSDPTVTVTATSVADPSASSAASLTLIPAGAGGVVALALDPVKATLVAGAQRAFKAFGLHVDGSSTDVTGDATWQCDPSSVATVTAAGLVSAVAPGTATVTATLGSASASTTLTVTAAGGIVAVVISPNPAALARGQAVGLAATATADDGTASDVTASAIWAIDTPSIASVGNGDQAGHVQALEVGLAHVSATYDGVTGTSSVQVTPAVLVSLILAPDPASLAAGASLQLVATGKYSDGSTSDVTSDAVWTSTNSAAATVGDDASDKGAVHGVSAGVATVTASVASNGPASAPVTGSVEVTVGPPVPVALAVSPSTVLLAAGLTASLSADVTLSDGSISDVTTQATWSSVAPAVASVSDDPASRGLVSALIPGQADIHASYAGLVASASVAVSAPVLQSIVLSPATASAPAGLTQAFTALGTWSNGATSDVTATATWSSTVPAIADVVPGTSGLVKTHAKGEATIQAAQDGVVGQATLTVTAAVAVSVAIAPPQPVVAWGGTIPLTAVATASDGVTSDVTTTALWASTDPTVASFPTPPGVCVAHAAGATIVSASVDGATGSATLTVQPPPLVSVAITPAEGLVAKGATTAFTATGTTADGATTDLTLDASWKAGSLKIAKVLSPGLVKGVGIGVTDVTATVAGLAAKATLEVSPPDLVSIVVVPSKATVVAGLTKALGAKATWSDGATSDVTALAVWTTDDPKVATVTSDAASHGVATGVGPGQASVTASMGAIAASASLTVAPAQIVSVTIEPTATEVPAGLTHAFKATAKLTTGTTSDVTAQAAWSSTNPLVASVQGGVAKGVKVGGTEIKCAIGALSASASLTVTKAVLVGLTVSPASTTIAKAETTPFTAQGAWSDGTISDVTGEVSWASSDPAVATLSNLAASHGVATGVGPGQALVLASLGGASGTATLTVTPPKLTGVTLSPPKMTLAAGHTQAFVATAAWSDGATSDVTAVSDWSSTVPATATVAAGLVSAVSPGATTIRATYLGAVGEASLTVSQATLVSIAVTPASTAVPQGLTQQLVATGTFSDGSTLDLTSSAAWSTADPMVATVSTAGVVTGAAVGAVQVFATKGSVKAAAWVTVVAAEVASVALTPVAASVATGLAVPFVATATYTSGATQDVTAVATWASSDPKVATVAAGQATGVAPGKSSISATFGGKTGKAPLTVLPALLTSIAVSPSPAAVAVGLTQAFKATGSYSDGSTAGLPGAAWGSADVSLATVSASGVATGVATGTVKITASFGGLVGQATLTVTSATLVGVTVSPTGASVAAGLKQVFTASGIYSDGSTAAVVATWSSVDPAVATISPQGVALGVAAGTVEIHASVGAIVGKVSLTVTAPVLTALSVSPATATVAAGQTQAYTATATYSNGTFGDVTAAVTWSTGDPGIATVSNLAATAGVVKAVGSGTTSVTATLGAFTAEASVVVPSAAISSIAVTPSTAMVAAGLKQAFVATATLTDGSTANVTAQVAWSSTNLSAATVTSAGVATGVAPGSTSIVATSGGVTGSAQLTVGAPLLTSVKVAPATSSVAVGLKQAFTATGGYSDGSTADLTSTAQWFASPASVATISNVAGSQGVATGVAAGTATVSAASGGVSGSATLVVTMSVVTSLSVVPQTASVAAGLKQPFTATATWSDGTTSNATALVAWTSTTPASATVSNAPGSQGVATGVSVGSTTIVATSGAVTGSAGLTVTAPVLTGVSVAPAPASVATGLKQAFTATGTWSNGATTDITATAAWSSTNPAAATVSNTAGSQGVATGVAQGTTTISASAGGSSGSAALTVTAPVLTGITVAPLSASISVGAKKGFTATGAWSDGTSSDVTTLAVWASSDPAVATLSNAAASAGVATGVTAGAVTVTATSGAIKGTASLTVTAATLTAISVSPLSATVAAGQKQAFAATGTWSDGSTSNVTTAVAWSSNGTSIATVSNVAGSQGVATGAAAGSVKITATSGGVLGTASLTVTAPVVASVTVAPSSLSLGVGLTASLVVTATMSDGTSSNVTAAATWASTAPSVATVDAGSVKAIALGSTSVVATWSGKSGSAAVTVVARYLPLKVGASWTYLTTDTVAGTSATRTTTVEAYEDVGGIKAGVMAYRVNQAKLKGSTIDWQEDAAGRIVRHHELNYSATAVLKTEVWYVNPSRLRIDESVPHTTLGASWIESYTSQSTKISTGVVTLTGASETWTVDAVSESVTVPAGTFSCLRLHRVDVANATDKTYWFARGVGKIKDAGGTQTEQLVSYTIP